MGWTYGWGTRRELVAYLTRPVDKPSYRIRTLAKAYRGMVLWTVQEITQADKVPRKGIIAYQLGGDVRNGYGWGYKDVDETMGPYQVTCPLKFLEMVPLPPDSRWAPEWRERVRAYAARLAQPLTVGQRIQLSGLTIKTGEIARLEGRKVFVRSEEGYVYRVPRRYISNVVEG